MKFWPGCLSLKHNKEVYCLFGIFFALVAIKSALTIPLQTPWIFADEAMYDKIAQSILDGTFFGNPMYCQTYPPGYSVFLSIAYLFSGDKTVIYHIMLVINTILTSSIIFPSYFVLKKYISQNQALLGSVLISVLPAVTLYNFVLMSENLFIPLTMFSIWFLHEAFETNKLRWSFLAGFSIFYLYFTRETGLVFCIALLVALAFFILNTERGARLKVMKNKVVLVCSFAIPVLAWMIYKIVVASQTSAYNIDSYSNTLFGAFSDTGSLEMFSTLLLHEIEYLALSGYIVIFTLAILFIIEILLKHIFPGPGDHLEQFCADRIRTLRLIIVYALTFSAGLLVITVTHMQKTILSTGNQEYLFFGRYIDPIIPTIFILGIIGFGTLPNKYTDLKRRSKILLCFSIPFIIFSVLVLSHTCYKFANMFGIYYIVTIQTYMGLFGGLILLTTLFLIIPYYILKNSHRTYFSTCFFLFFLVLSMFLSIPTYEKNYEIIENVESVNQISRYLQDHSTAETKILMDNEDFKSLTHPQWYLTQFWTKSELIRRSTTEDPAGIFTKEFVGEADYIISKKLLDYPCMAVSPGWDFYLYEPQATSPSISKMTMLGFKRQSDVGYEYYDITVGENIYYSPKLTSSKGYLAYGPYINLPAGNHTIEYLIKAENITSFDEIIATVDILSTYKDHYTTEHVIDARKSIYGRDLNEGNYTSISLELSITEETPSRLIEFRVFQTLNSDLYVKEINVRTSNNTHIL